MKKVILFVLCSSLLMSSCDTYTGSGAYAGGSIGSILGSAIGGLSGGPRGSDMGTIIGMASGAAIGAVIGNQADKSSSEREAVYENDKIQRHSHSNIPSRSDRSTRNQHNEVYDYSSPLTDNSDIFDSNNGGDDRLYDFQGKDYTGDYSAQQPTTCMPSATVEELGARLSYSPTLSIVNARFVDANEDSYLNSNETCKIIFEVMNLGQYPVYDVVATVIETTGNKHIFISPSIHVEKIEPGSGVRYTAMVKADKKLKDGDARFCVSVIHEGKSISKVNEFNIPTKR